MAKRMSVMLFVALALSATPPRFGSACTQENATPDTARLSVTIKAKTLQEAPSEISRISGVRIKAATDVGDLKVTILVHDMPMDSLRARLAEVLHLTWKEQIKPGSQPASFLIYRSLRNIEEENELKARGERAFRKGIDSAISALSLTRDQRAKLFADHPNLERTFADAGGEAGVSLLAQIPAEMRTSIMDGNNLEFSPKSPPADLAANVDQVMKQMQAANTSLIVARIFGMDGKFIVLRNGEGANSGIGIGFNVQTETIAGGTGVGIQGTNSSDAYPELYPHHEGTAYAGDRVPLTIHADLTADTMDDLLAKVADTLRINIICENYRQYFNGKPDTAAGLYPIKVKAGISSIEQIMKSVVWMYSWWKHDGTYLVQRPLWWIDRRPEVTDAQLNHVKEILAKPPLTFEAMADIGKTLNEYQWDILVGISSPIRYDMYLEGFQELLRFYGNLSPSVKSSMFGGDGVRASSLRNEDMERLAYWIYQVRKGAFSKLPSVPDSVHVTAMRQLDASGQHVVLFRAVLVADDGSMKTLREQSIQDFASDKNKSVNPH